jgi:GNAT superfamily N-acetyltransferase
MTVQEQQSQAASDEITIRELTEADLDAADEIFRVAFGTFLGLPEPRDFAGDADYVRTRFAAGCTAFAAEAGGELIGSNFVTRWGSVGYFGPLTIRPDYWDRGVASRLLEATNATFDEWDVSHRGLFTFGHSPKHVGLYGKMGYSAGFLTAIMAKPVGQGSGRPAVLSDLEGDDRARALAGCREVADAVYPGLDLEHEITAVEGQALGDTVLLMAGDRVEGFAVCHCGAGSEAGSGTCFVKFGAVRPGEGADERFEQLLDAVESFAADRSLKTVVAGANMGRREAYQAMCRRGYRAQLQGVAMHSGDDLGYNNRGSFVIDDWR